MGKVCCFTGHRPEKLYGYDIYSPEYIKLAKIIKNYIIKELIPAGYDTFVVGGALGFDTVAFFIINKLKNRHPNLRIILAVPFKNQPIKWNNEDRNRYNEMLKLADAVVQVDEVLLIKKYGEKYVLSKEFQQLGQFSKSKLFDRNNYMVNISDFIIGVWDGSKSGTGQCIQYAQKNKVKGIYINPHTYKIINL